MQHHATVASNLGAVAAGSYQIKIEFRGFRIVAGVLSGDYPIPEGVRRVNGSTETGEP
jgi:hypothetical protein